MAKITSDIPYDLAREMERVIRDGWFVDENAIVREALHQFIDSKTFLGDSPRMLHRFAADALNESKPETALKFIDRALSLLANQQIPDLHLYQQMIELRVQILLIMERRADALIALEEALEKLPNSPAIGKWITRLRKEEAAELSK